MARLPIVGGDSGNWGTILNDFLEVSLNGDGTIQPAAITQAGAVTSVNTVAPNASGNVTLTAASVGAYTKPSGGIPSSDLSSSVQADLSAAGSAVQLGGDLGGTATAPVIAKLQGTPVNAASPAANQVLSYVSGEWVPATASSGSVNDATTSAPGIVQLSGDISGTATEVTVTSTHLTDALPIDQGGTGSATQNFLTLGGDLGNSVTAPKVESIQGVAISGAPSANQALIASSSSAASWGTIPTASNATSSTPGLIQLDGDLGNTATNPEVVSLKGIALPSSAPSANQVLTATSATATEWMYPASVTLPLPSGDETGATDTAAIQAAENALSALGGGTILFQPGTYWTTGLMKQSLTTWQGAGWEVTFLQLADGANADVVQGADFGSLTGTGSDGGIYGWAIRDMCIDGNKANQSGPSWCLRVYGYLYLVENVIIRNAYSDGHWSEWQFSPSIGATGDCMQAAYRNVDIHDNNGWGWHGRGPHDSFAENVVTYNNNQSAGTAGNWWFEDDNSGAKKYLMGSLQMVNCHSWGLTNNWGVINDSDLVMSGCQMEGALYGAILNRKILTAAACKIFWLSPGTGGETNGCGIQFGDDGSTSGVPSSFSYQSTGNNIASTTLKYFAGVGRSSAPVAWVNADYSTIDIRSTPFPITVSSGSNGQSVTALTGNQLFVSIVAGLPSSGSIYVQTSAGYALIAYTSVTSGSTPSLNGITVTSGSGTVETGYTVAGAVLYGNLDIFTTARISNITQAAIMGATSVAQQAGPTRIEAGQSASSWSVTDNGTVIEVINAASSLRDFNGGLELRGWTGNYASNVWNLELAKQHMSWPNGTAPTGAVVTAATGTTANGAAAGISGNDRRGTFTITTASTGLGSSWPATVANFTFAQAYSVAPKVVITPVTGAAAGVQAYANGFSTTEFLVGFNAAPEPSTAYQFAFVVEG